MEVSSLSWCLRSNDVDSRGYASIARTAEQLGYQGMFSVEGTLRSALPHLITGNIRSAFINNAAAAMNTSHITLGTSIVSMYSRTPLAICMEAATLNELSGGRFVLGIGVGGPWLVQKGYGYPLDRPAVRMREFLTIIKLIFSGEKVDFEGEFFKIKDVKMNRLTDSPPRIYMGGLNPAMLRVGGMLADGVILNMFPIKALQFAREKISEGAEKIGRDPNTIKIYVLAPCGVSDEENVIEQLKLGIAFYCHITTHHKFLAYAGLENEAKAIHDAWNKSGPSKAADMVSEDLLNVLTLGYTPAQIANRCREYLAEGVLPLLYPHYRKEDGLSSLIELMRKLKQV